MATKANLSIDQGSTFSCDVAISDENGDPLDMTGYTAAGQIRKSYASSNAVSFAIVLTNGNMNLSLTANQTSNVVAGRYVYDVELTKAGEVSRVIEGLVTIRPEVTR